MRDHLKMRRKKEPVKIIQIHLIPEEGKLILVSSHGSLFKIIRIL
jgi:hypothetical protein